MIWLLLECDIDITDILVESRIRILELCLSHPTDCLAGRFLRVTLWHWQLISNEETVAVAELSIPLLYWSFQMKFSAAWQPEDAGAHPLQQTLVSGQRWLHHPCRPPLHHPPGLAPHPRPHHHHHLHPAHRDSSQLGGEWLLLLLSFFLLSSPGPV